MTTATRRWRRFGASASAAATLEREGLRPLWGGQDLPDSGWLDMIDMSQATINGIPFDSVVASYGMLSTPPDSATAQWFQTDAAGNIYDQNNQMVLSNAQLTSMDASLAAEIAAQPPIPNAMSAGDQASFYYDAASGQVLDAQGNVIAGADDLRAAGIDPSAWGQGS